MPQLRSRGYSMIEVLTCIAIIGLFLVIAIPQIDTINRQRQMRAAAQEVKAVLGMARSRAIAKGRNCAIKFREIDGVWWYAMYEDGDGDGVRNDDIDRGVDRRLHPYREVLSGISAIRIATPAYRKVDPVSGDPILPTSSPVQFGRSTLASFSPIGGATAGSVYLSDGRGRCAAVRVLGASGRIRLAIYRDGKLEGSR